jgi:hypothetical protein
MTVLVCMMALAVTPPSPEAVVLDEIHHANAFNDRFGMLLLGRGSDKASRELGKRLVLSHRQLDLAVESAAEFRGITLNDWSMAPEAQVAITKNRVGHLDRTALGHSGGNAPGPTLDAEGPLSRSAAETKRREEGLVDDVRSLKDGPKLDAAATREVLVHSQRAIERLEALRGQSDRGTQRLLARAVYLLSVNVAAAEQLLARGAPPAAVSMR